MKRGDDAFTVLRVGAPYPGMIGEGIMLDAFARGGTLLRIGMDAMTTEEAKLLRKARIGVRVRDAGEAVAEVEWRFGGRPAGASPFDARIAHEAGNLVLPEEEIADGTGIIVQLHGVDTATRTVRALRVFTMPTKASQTLLALTRQRLEDTR